MVHKDSKIALPPKALRTYAADTMQHDSDRTADRRVTVLEAAKLLSITPDAVRARLRRGTMRKERGEDGTLLVVLEGHDGDTTATEQPTEQPTVAYINTLKSRIELLERELGDWKEQLKEEREANRENRRIIAGLVQRVPELEPAREAAPEPRESPVTAPEESDNGRVGAEAQKPSEQRSWLRRFFFGP